MIEGYDKKKIKVPDKKNSITPTVDLLVAKSARMKYLKDTMDMVRGWKIGPITYG